MALCDKERDQKQNLVKPRFPSLDFYKKRRRVFLLSRFRLSIDYFVDTLAL